METDDSNDDDDDDDFIVEFLTWIDCCLYSDGFKSTQSSRP